MSTTVGPNTPCLHCTHAGQDVGGQGRVMYFVDSGGWARRLDDLGSPPVHASNLLDPDKKMLR